MNLPNRHELSRELDKLAETQVWTHQVADFDTGKVETHRLDRPIAPLSRAERMSRLGHVIDDTIFGGPFVRLTPRRPYQESPAAWFYVSTAGGYYAEFDYIVWRVPRGPDDRGFMTFHFAESPALRSVVSISIASAAEAGGGHIRVLSEQPFREARFPITGNAMHTLDLTFVPVEGRPVDIWMIFEEGIGLTTFRSVSFGPAPLVFNERAV
jgi:hypothetical protein